MEGIAADTEVLSHEEYYLPFSSSSRWRSVSFTMRSALSPEAGRSFDQFRNQLVSSINQSVRPFGKPKFFNFKALIAARLQPIVKY